MMHFYAQLCLLLPVVRCMFPGPEKGLEYPEYFEILSNETSTKEYSGFYQKYNDEISVYKKLKSTKYLYTKNQLWTLGNKRKDGGIFYLDSECDLPTSSDCKGQWKRQLDNKAVEVKVLSKPKPIYPNYYQIRAEGSVKEKIKEFLGFYEKESDMYHKFPYYKNTNGKVLKLNKNGKWTMSKGKYGKDHVQSISEAHPSPPKKNLWESWNEDSQHWETNSSISVLPFEHPDSYLLEYTGNKEKVKDILGKNNLLGYYEKQKQQENGAPYYVKLVPETIYLSKKDNMRWSFSSGLSDGFGFLYQDFMNDPAPREWEVWELNVGSVGTKSGITLTSVKKEDNGKENGGKKENNLVLTVLITCTPVVVFVALIAVVCLVVKCRKKLTPEEPKIDENFYYGDEDYYDEKGNCVIDTNDYYE
eukprot:GFUD01083094.1.p1 GENE.GFUD01083094.1~~GFUD01083094.1.p1  ORF type:complete len:417 (-),score=95.26 GFUD01083094.1:22-1272(-)